MVEKHSISAVIERYPRRAKRALGSEENSSVLSLIDSEIARQIRLKLGGIIEGIAENDLAKEFLNLLMLTGIRSVGHGCLF